jgi:hypothetical protein
MFAHSHSESQLLRHLPQHWNSIMLPPHCGHTRLMIDEMIVLGSPGNMLMILMALSVSRAAATTAD